MTTTKPEVDDVIVSKDFAFGYRHFGIPNYIFVDGQTTSLIASTSLSEDERISIAAKTGSIPEKSADVDYGAYDESRGTAEFVVEHAAMEGGDERNSIPDSWHIVARRLNKDGSYNKDGEVIDFYTVDYHSTNVPLENITIKRKMKKAYV